MTAEHPGFAGKTAVITGGASGIGRATAQELHALGAHVVIVDKDADGLDAATRDFTERLTVVQADVSEARDCQRAATEARNVGSPVVALVNSAASFLAKGESATSADWDIALGTNVKGTALMASALAPQLRIAGGAAIVNLASISGFIAQPDRWTYNATKGAIHALTRCQALDFASDGIRVNSVSPGTIWTPELDRMTDSDRQTWEPILGTQHMLGRTGEPFEVSNAIVFLCSPAASFITGADLLVDGGYLAMGHDSDVSIRYRNE